VPVHDDQRSGASRGGSRFKTADNVRKIIFLIHSNPIKTPQKLRFRRKWINPYTSASPGIPRSPDALTWNGQILAGFSTVKSTIKKKHGRKS
jgi:hypothetical protein